MTSRPPSATSWTQEVPLTESMRANLRSGLSAWWAGPAFGVGVFLICFLVGAMLGWLYDQQRTYIVLSAIVGLALGGFIAVGLPLGDRRSRADLTRGTFTRTAGPVRLRRAAGAGYSLVLPGGVEFPLTTLEDPQPLSHLDWAIVDSTSRSHRFLQAWDGDGGPPVAVGAYHPTPEELSAIAPTSGHSPPVGARTVEAAPIPPAPMPPGPIIDAHSSLGHAMHFDVAELQSNREGRMTGLQRRRVLVSGGKWLLGTLVLLPFTGRCVQMNFEAFGSSYDDLASRIFEQGLIIAVGLILVAIFFVACTSAFSRLLDAATGTVRSVTGLVKTRTQASTATYWGTLSHPHLPLRRTRVSYYLDVGDEEFEVDRAAYEAAPSGTASIYYSPLSHVPLSME